ncbi:MAG: hypothetical protein Fues2KO_46910 [Fuerstiella sp.]
MGSQSRDAVSLGPATQGLTAEDLVYGDLLKTSGEPLWVMRSQEQ